MTGKSKIRRSKTHGIVAGWHSEFGGQLAGFLRRGVRAPEDVQDLAQEVFLRLLRVEKPQLVRSPKAYLYRVAIHVLDEWRSRERRAHFTSLTDQEEGERAEDIRGEERQRQTTVDVNRALQALPAPQAAALILHWHHGMTYPEIAERLSVTERMVKRYIVKGYAKMRLQLEEGGEHHA